MSNENPLIDVSELTDNELKNIKSDVLKRLLDGQTLPRKIGSNLETSHDRHSSVHSKG